MTERCNVKNPIIVAVIGGMDLIHIGHIRHIQKAKELGDILIVILQSDQWLINKKGYIALPYLERKEILESIKGVDKVVPAMGNNSTCEESLRYYKPTILAKGGDRTKEQMPKIETETCEQLGIKIVYDVGGGKINSSSWIIKNVLKQIEENQRVKK